MMLPFYLLLLFGIRFGCSLRLLQVVVPSQRHTGEPVTLRCRFDLQGDALYSVKWYKGGKEFFRYVPKDNPPKQRFHVDGVNVNLSASDEYQVILDRVSLQSAGRYKCEVSAEAPFFQTVYDYGEMSVIALPAESAQISGIQTTYQIGEYITGNCTLSRSKPAGNLSWIVNNRQAAAESLIRYPVQYEPDGLESAILGLQFKIEERHFQDGGLRLVCSASVGNSQWRTQLNISQTDVQHDFPRHRTLASRPAASTSGSQGRLENSAICGVILFLVYRWDLFRF